MGGWGMYDYEPLPTSRQPKKKDPWRAVRGARPLGDKFVECLEGFNPIPPSAGEMRLMRNQITKLMTVAERHPLVLASIIRPDWRSQIVESRQVYFSGLGNEVSLMAHRALHIHHRLLQSFWECGVRKVRSEIIMADQEATELNCTRMGISKGEFVSRLRQSQETLMTLAREQGVGISTPMLTELYPDFWQRTRSEAGKQADAITSGQITAVRITRSNTFQRWTGRCLGLDELNEMIKGQAAEYIAVGKYLASQHRLIIGLGDPAMAPFLRRGTVGQSPVVYFRRPDY